MNIEEIRDYCISKVNVSESFPFGPDVLVFKVNSKAFLLLPLNQKPVQFNVKCDPELAIGLREQYDCVKPGYHMNKKHWNTIIVDGSIARPMLQEWINHSYILVNKNNKSRKK